MKLTIAFRFWSNKTVFVSIEMEYLIKIEDDWFIYWLRQ